MSRWPRSRFGSAVVAAAAGGGAAWAPNRPAATGTLLTDYLFNYAGTYPTAADTPDFDGSGWGLNGGTIAPATDATAPQDPSTVARITYPASGGGGGGEGNFYRNLSAPTRIYVCISFKHSVPFDWNGGFRVAPQPLDSGSGSNKFLVLFGPSTPGNINLETRFFADLTGSDPPYWLQVVNGPTDQIFPDALISSLNLDDGAWHTVEWYVDSVIGRMQCWADGALKWTWNRSFPGGWDLLLLSTTWGGGGQHAFQCFRYYDRVTVYTN